MRKMLAKHESGTLWGLRRYRGVRSGACKRGPLGRARSGWPSQGPPPAACRVGDTGAPSSPQGSGSWDSPTRRAGRRLGLALRCRLKMQSGRDLRGWLVYCQCR